MRVLLSRPVVRCPLFYAQIYKTASSIRHISDRGSNGPVAAQWFVRGSQLANYSLVILTYE